MKSENSTNPAADEEVIELTDVVASGPEAEEAIIDLTDPIETVKAEPYDPEKASSGGQPLELSEMLAPDTAEELIDLTDPLDTPLEEETVLDLDEVIDEEGAALDLTQAVADAKAEFAAKPEVLDLAEALDAAETEDDFLELDSTTDGGVEDTSLIAEKALEAVDDMLEEVADTGDDGGGDTVSEEVPPEDLPEKSSAVVDEDEDSVLVLERPLGDETGLQGLGVTEDELAEQELGLDDLADEATFSADTMGSEPALDLVETDAAPAETAFDAADAADDDDDLEFKLDEMLAEAQADMPDLDDDDTEMELDLSEALAEAAAESNKAASETFLDVGSPLVPLGEEASEDIETLDLISDDKIIELDDIVEGAEAATDTEEAAADDVIELEEAAVDDIIELEEAATDNVIELADITGGYPTVDTEEAQGIEADTPAEIDLEDGDLDIDLIDADAMAEAASETELNPEMKELEATLDDMLQDDDGDDMELGMFADNAIEADDEAASSAAVDSTEAGKDEAGTLGAGALGAAALSEAASGAAATIAGEFNNEGQPTGIPEETLDAAVARVIKTMYADRIEQMVLDVIKEAVTAEIEKVKRSLSD
jgi:hypothetical protein